MSKRSSIELQLTPAHLRRLNERLNDRRLDGRDHLSWLRRRGYRISQRAVYRYWQRQLRKPLAASVPLILGSAGQLRRRIIRDARRLDFGELLMLASYTAFLLSAKAAARDRAAIRRRRQRKFHPAL